MYVYTLTRDDKIVAVYSRLDKAVNAAIEQIEATKGYKPGYGKGRAGRIDTWHIEYEEKGGSGVNRREPINAGVCSFDGQIAFEMRRTEVQ